MCQKKCWGLMNCYACGRHSRKRPACSTSWTISIRTPLLCSTKSFRQSRPKPSSTAWNSTTPQHASWLDIAEIELSVWARQGLAHNIATIEELCQQIQSWQTHLHIPLLLIHSTLCECSQFATSSKRNEFSSNETDHPKLGTARSYRGQKICPGFYYSRFASALRGPFSPASTS